jgi:hypothetical protein
VVEPGSERKAESFAAAELSPATRLLHPKPTSDVRRSCQSIVADYRCGRGARSGSPERTTNATELALPDCIGPAQEHHMADNKNPNEKEPGEKPEGKYHYNPGNQSKDAEMVPKEEAKKDK